MPLPENNSGAWPPPAHTQRLTRMREARAWYGGDRAKLAAMYGGSTGAASSHIATTINPEGKGLVQRAVSAISNRFWSRTVAAGETDTRRHLPIAQDIAILSSEWLFGEPCTFRVNGPVYESDAEASIDPATNAPTPAHRKGDPLPETVKAQEALDAILEANSVESLLLQSGEIGAALGSMPLRVVLNRAMFDTPRLVRVDPAACVPMFSWGALTGVVFWREVRVGWASGNVVVRHLELHEGGRIFHGLYRGAPDQLGVRIPMAEGDADCQAIAVNLDADSAIVKRFEHQGKPLKTATSIPNVLPDPLDIDNLVGRSDYTPAVIDLMDAADHLYSQFMENVEDARGRVLLSKAMLESGGIGKGMTFDSSQRYFTKLNLPPTEKDGALPIEKVQFELRAEEYLASIDAITSKAIEAAGWNPETGSDEGAAPMTATEVHDRRKRSNSTRDKKLAYVRRELEALAFTLLVLHSQEFDTTVKPYPVEVQFPPAVQPSITELAQTAQTLRAAKAASTQVLVELVHPDWDKVQVAKEVERLEKESRTIDPATIGLSARLPGDAPQLAAPQAPTGPQAGQQGEPA